MPKQNVSSRKKFAKNIISGNQFHKLAGLVQKAKQTGRDVPKGWREVPPTREEIRQRELDLLTSPEYHALSIEHKAIIRKALHGKSVAKE
ncbi:MAG: hypothetical protein NTY48_00355, partial [Candidatus Diapherotrites archaeon]|nr:hypothetical protein [Candidatus Diapherotrites archaeon]